MYEEVEKDGWILDIKSLTWNQVTECVNSVLPLPQRPASEDYDHLTSLNHWH